MKPEHVKCSPLIPNLDLIETNMWKTDFLEKKFSRKSVL